MMREDDSEAGGLRRVVDVPVSTGDDLEAELDALGKQWLGDDSPGVAPPAAEEKPAKETGDEKVAMAEQVDDPDLQQLRAQDDSEKGMSTDVPDPAMGSSAEGPEAPVPLTDAPPKEPWAALKYGLRENETRPPPPSALGEKMKAVGWESKPGATAAAPEGPPDWGKLKADLEASAHNAETQRTIGAMLHAAAPGFVPPSNAGGADVEASEKLLAEAHAQEQAKQVAERSKSEEALRQQQIEASKAEVAHKAQADLLAKAKDQAMNDTAGPEAKKARDTYRPVFDLLGHIPDGYEQMSANDIEKAVKALSPIAVGAVGRKKTEAELTAKEKAATEADASLVSEREGISHNKLLPKLGYTPEQIATMDRHGIDKVRDELEKLGHAKGGAGTGAPAKAIRTVDDIPDPSDRAKVQALINGGVGISEALSRKDKDRVMGYLLQVKPDYDSSKHATYAAIAKQIAEDPAIHSALTAKEHFKRALENMPDNLDANIANHIVNAIQKGTGGTGLSKFEADIAVGAGELSKGLGENAEAGKEAVKRLLEPGQSKGQLRDHLMELVYLQDEGIELKRRKFESAAPKGTALPEILKREAPAGEHPAGAEQKTPSGKSFFKKQINMKTNRIRYLDKDGGVIEETNG